MFGKSLLTREMELRNPCEIDPTRPSMYLVQSRGLGEIRGVLFIQNDLRRRAFVMLDGGRYDFRVVQFLTSEYRVTANRDLRPMMDKSCATISSKWLADDFGAR